MDWMQEACGTSRFIAAGLCGGALTGLLAAERDPRIVGLLGLSIPVILDGSGTDASRYMTDAQLSQTRTGYLRRLRFWDAGAWSSWARLLTFRSDYRLIARSLIKPIEARFRGARPAVAGVQAQPADNTNPRFAPAFLRMVSTSRPVLLVFAESDRLYWEFDAKFMRVHRASVAAYEPSYAIPVVGQANRVFSFADWQRELLDVSRRWLERVFPAGLDGSVSGR